MYVTIVWKKRDMIGKGEIKMSDLGLIIASILGLIGTVIILQLNQAGWFKKQKWLADRDTQRSINKIKLKKLEKDLGVTTSKNTAIPQGGIGLLGQLAPLLKNLSGDQLMDLANRFLPQEGEYEEAGTGSLAEGLISYATQNPQIAGQLIANLTGGSGNAAQITQGQNSQNAATDDGFL